MNKKISDLNLKNSMHVDRHEEQSSMPSHGSAVPAHKLKQKVGGMSGGKAAEYKADVMSPDFQRGPGSMINSDTQSIAHDKRGGGKSTS
jgi:hypothetical protein